MSDQNNKDPLLGGNSGDAGSTNNSGTGKTEEIKTPKVKGNGQTTAEETKAILAKCPKVSFIIPLSEGEKPGQVETVQINGYGLTIQKGVMVELPKPVANLLAEKYHINMTAGMEKQIGRSAEISEALS